MRRLASLLLLSSCISGPTYVVQQYEGPRRAADSVAIVRVDGDDVVSLERIDDVDIVASMSRMEGSRYHFEVLPGRHVLGVSRRPPPVEGVTVARAPSPGSDASPYVTRSVAFDAAAGKVYRTVFENGEPRVHEVGRTSDALGPDVTIASEAREP